ncbi:hypothetical protein PoB_001736500 [Plakobranchus ocellatus]|uniref:BEN domain-containing protein n=1 Tax=Plakobranchus ocellatus TaxID=259542 RepID=A0AAV3Z5W7_9GAST|nr:hypothetical protein PoB_001736500 [Plakobranchus ocellatus]
MGTRLINLKKEWKGKKLADGHLKATTKTRIRTQARHRPLFISSCVSRTTALLRLYNLSQSWTLFFIDGYFCVNCPDLFSKKIETLTNAVVVELETYRNRSKLKPTFSINWLTRLCPNVESAVLSKNVKQILKEHGTKQQYKPRHPEEYEIFMLSCFPPPTSEVKVGSSSTTTVNTEEDSKPGPGQPRGPSQEHVKILTHKYLNAKDNWKKATDRVDILTKDLKNASKCESHLASEKGLLVKKSQNDDLLNEKEHLTNQLASIRKSKMYKRNRKLKLKVAELNRYSSNVRKTVLALQGEGNVAASKCSTVLKIVAKHLFNKPIAESDLPSTQTCLNTASEGQALSKMQIASEILHSNNVVLHTDAISRDKRKYLGQQINLEDGAVLSLGYCEMAESAVTIFKRSNKRANRDNLQEMRKAVWAVYFHKLSSDIDATHQFCGDWCP